MEINVVKQNKRRIRKTTRKDAESEIKKRERRKEERKQKRRRRLKSNITSASEEMACPFQTFILLLSADFHRFSCQSPSNILRPRGHKRASVQILPCVYPCESADSNMAFAYRAQSPWRRVRILTCAEDFVRVEAAGF